MYTTLEHRCYIYSNTTSPHTRTRDRTHTHWTWYTRDKWQQFLVVWQSALIILCIYDYGIHIHYIVHTCIFLYVPLFESFDAHKMFNIYVNTCLYCMWFFDMIKEIYTTSTQYTPLYYIYTLPIQCSLYSTG